MMLQPLHGDNAIQTLDRKQRNPKGLRASPARHPTIYGITTAWAARNRAKIGGIAP